MKCPHCQNSIPEDSVFCNFCGERINLCSSCGRNIPDDSEFCPFCGTRVKEAVQPKEPPITQEVPPATSNSDLDVADQKPIQQTVSPESPPKKKKTAIFVFAALGIVLVACAIIVVTVILPKQKLNKAMSLIDAGDYESAYSILSELGKESIIEKNKHDRAVALDQAGDYEAAYAMYKELGDETAILQSKYNRAISLFNAGEYEEAYTMLYDLNYKDSHDKLEQISTAYKREIKSSSKEGSTITLGKYEQDNNTSNGKEDIEWLVLKKETDRILVVSKYALDSLPYNNLDANTTWEACSLRKWLNADFLDSAFNNVEQTLIRTSTVKTLENPIDYFYQTTPTLLGDTYYYVDLSYLTSTHQKEQCTTMDRLFILDITEYMQFFDSADNYSVLTSGDPTACFLLGLSFDSACCSPTKYAVAQGCYSEEGQYCTWWLRSPGNNRNEAMYVFEGTGGVNLSGLDVTIPDFAVRPAMWIDLS